jgi:hypothetical protein
MSWSSDKHQIGCDTGGKVRAAFSLGRYDRRIMGFVATTAGIHVENVHNFTAATELPVIQRHGQNGCTTPTPFIRFKHLE